MGTGYSIPSFGANYANDPFFMNTLNSPNILAMMQAQQQSQLLAQQQQAAAAGTNTTGVTDSTSATPSFQGTSATAQASDSGIGLGTGLLVGGAVLGGALACVEAYRRRDGGSIFRGFKNLGKAIINKFSSTGKKAGEEVGTAINNLIKNGGKNLQEYTIKKGGNEFVIKDGKPIKIITQDKKIIDPKDISKWIRENNGVQNEIRKLNLTGKLPTGVSLTYTKEIKDGKNLYKLVVENGKVVKASSKDRSGKWVEVAENQFEGFINNHKNVVKKAETLTRTFSDKNVKLLNKKGKLVSQKGSIQMNVRDGKIISAKYNGSRDLKPEELKALNKDYESIAKEFGKESGAKYGLTSKEFEYIYKKDGHVVKFNPITKNITAVNALNTKTITNASAINSYLEKNGEIQSALNEIASGSIPNGYRLGQVIYKNDNGIAFDIYNNVINGIRLDKDITIKGKGLSTKTFKAGELIDGKYLGKWRETAENDNAFRAIVEMLK